MEQTEGLSNSESYFRVVNHRVFRKPTDSDEGKLEYIYTYTFHHFCVSEGGSLLVSYVMPQGCNPELAFGKRNRLNKDKQIEKVPRKGVCVCVSEAANGSLLSPSPFPYLWTDRL